MRSGVIVVSVFALAGCMREGMGTPEFANEVGTPAPVTEASVQSVVTVKESSDEPAVVVEEPAAAPVRHGPDPVFFRMGAGYGALGRVDLSPCRSEGLPAGYLRLRVTFHVSGRVVRAAVESATTPPNEALSCISEQLELAMVPAFEGGEVTLSKSFFVN